MFTQLIQDLKVFRKCPEIRTHIFRLYAAKTASYTTLLVFSPLMLLGIIAIVLVHVMDYVGQYALCPAHKFTNWLHDFQQNQIRSAHNILAIEEIQERIGDRTDEDL